MKTILRTLLLIVATSMITYGATAQTIRKGPSKKDRARIERRMPPRGPECPRDEFRGPGPEEHRGECRPMPNRGHGPEMRGDDRRGPAPREAEHRGHRKQGPRRR